MSERSGRNRYVAIEGPIGVGKTTLARRLARDLDAELVLEGASDNPFLARFYQSPERYALATQLHFLMQRAEQLDGLRQHDMFSATRVADFMLEKDRLFAELTLGHDEYRLYEQVYRHIIEDFPRPDLVIYLQAPVTTLLERISMRGIDYESRIEPHYLERLAARYVDFFRDFDAAPLLVVDALQTDLVHREADYHRLLSMMAVVAKGHHYLTPSVL